MWKIRLLLIRFASAFVFVASFVKADAVAQLTKLNVGYVGVTSDNAAAFIARETGIYARNGLDVQLIYFNSGSTAVTAPITGDTPISQTAGPSVNPHQRTRKRFLQCFPRLDRQALYSPSLLMY
jgi:ABC-type nitrate/sulfonate/bicarbonate transport system substrate-binding protein